ncbi:MAG: hypothetical protein ACOC0D_07725, partial [Spirochaeta sp.]
QAIEDVYQFINAEGDMVAHHFQQGIPYTAADTLDFSTYHQNIQNEIDGRISSTAAGKVIYLAIDSLNAGRDDVAKLWGEHESMDLPDPWGARGFDSPEVIEAYVEFSLAVLHRFETRYGTVPAYFNYASEISELMIHDPDQYSQFVTFAASVYGQLKAAYPSVKLMVSLALKSPGSGEMETVKTGFARISDYVDVVGISTYGYAFYSHQDKGNPDNLPPNWLNQIEDIAPGKAYGVTETGWIAEDLSIPAYSLEVQGSPAYQNSYLERLFSESQQDIQAQMIILFTAYDYDKLWSDTLGSDNLSKIWKDTGLRDEAFNDRSALATWREWQSLERDRRAAE